jgi:hypothetical protein
MDTHVDAKPAALCTFTHRWFIACTLALLTLITSAEAVTQWSVKTVDVPFPVVHDTRIQGFNNAGVLVGQYDDRRSAVMSLRSQAQHKPARFPIISLQAINNAGDTTGWYPY